MSYTGCTRNLHKRMSKHYNGKVYSTKNKLPVTIIFACSFLDKFKAFNFEKYLKTGSGRAFMKKRLL